MLTRGNDSRFSDFVDWVLKSLLQAEVQGITQNTASMMGTTDVFGAKFENMFIDAVRAVGNYEEMYARHLEVIVPRDGLNLINRGTALIYSHPFGGIETIGSPPFPGGTLEAVLARGMLNCGLTGSAQHFDIGREYCKALSAAIFGPRGDVKLVDLTDSNLFSVLADGDIDVLSNAPLSLATDVLEPTTGQGFTFSRPFFYSTNE